MPFPHLCICSWNPLHWINFSQSSGYGQYPLDDVAGHGQITEGAGTVNFNKLITNCIAIFLLGL